MVSGERGDTFPEIYRALREADRYMALRILRPTARRWYAARRCGDREKFAA
jgi:hypothetical protein